MNGTKKKGATLAELCVVLALVAIIGAMVASFSIMLSRQTQVSTARVNAMNDMEAVETIAESWLGQMKLLGAKLSLQEKVSTGQKWLQAKVGTGINSKEYTLIFDEEKYVLEGTLPDGKVMSFAPAEVKWILFDQVVNDSKTDEIFYYTYIYELPTLGGGKEVQQVDQVFFLNPHVGDTYDSISESDTDTDTGTDAGTDTGTGTDTGSEGTAEGGASE